MFAVRQFWRTAIFLMHFKNVCRVAALAHDKGFSCVFDKWRTTKVLYRAISCRAAFAVRRRRTTNPLFP
jgi:hypothetical protein